MCEVCTMCEECKYMMIKYELYVYGVMVKSSRWMDEVYSEYIRMRANQGKSPERKRFDAQVSVKVRYWDSEIGGPRVWYPDCRWLRPSNTKKVAVGVW